MGIIASAKGSKEYEKPETGMYHGVLADVVDLGNVTTQFKGEVKVQHMVRFVWVLNTLGKDKLRYPDTFEKPLTATQRFNLSMHEKANLYKTVKQILNAPPPVSEAQPEYDVEQLLGVVRKIFILRELSEDGKKDYPNVQGISAADPGVTVSLPQGYVRAKFRDKTQARPVTQQVATTAQGADVSF
jgi:hypothetical protein